MLNKLTIKNIALIENVEINFTKGLNVLSGETGSGKSVIIESLNFVLGAKADKNLIRTGESECFVCAEFDLEDCEEIRKVFNELDFEFENTLIVSRKYNIDGKSLIKINGNTVTCGMLKKFTSLLVDVHGQSEHFELLSLSNQLKLIDRYGGDKISVVKNKLKNVFVNYKNVLNELENLGGDERQRLTKLDILNFQIDEIKTAEIKEGEEEELLSLKQKVNNQERIINSLSCVKNSINEEGGVSDILSNSLRTIKGISELSKDYSDLSNRFDSVYEEILDIANSAENMLESFDDYDLSPEEIESRLEVIKRIKRKYGTSFEEISAFYNSAVLEKDKLEHFNELAESLLNEKEKYQKEVYSLYNELSALRKEFSNKFSDSVIKELHELGMPNADFGVKFNEIPKYDNCEFNSANGFDDLEFLFSANLGEPLKPLSQIISGGEMSRFMLAIKAQTAKYNDIGTFIFDEIDSGISGNIARVVAEKFAKISKDTQIIAITHLPQIASFADTNLLIYKIETKDKTYTALKQLVGKDKIFEIIRLMGSKNADDASISVANNLIDEALNFKNNI